MKKSAWYLGLGILILIVIVLIAPMLERNEESQNTSLRDAKNGSGVGQEGLSSACTTDSECVPASCCHARSCVAASEAPSCRGVYCTQVCEPGTLDCGQARCACVNNRCEKVEEE